MTNLKLVEPYIGGASVDLSEEQFLQLKTWHKMVSALIEVELLFSAVAKSAFEFEKFLLMCPLEDLFEHRPVESLKGAHLRFDGLSNDANVLLLTFLSAVRAYHDQRPSILKEGGVANEIRAEVKAQYKEAYDESFDYRLMEALRNYAQHNRLPIHRITLERSGEWDGRPASNVPSRQRNSVALFLSKEKMLEHRIKLKPSIVPELANLPHDRIELKLIFRNYVSLLTRSHLGFRAALQLSVDDAEEGLMRVHADFVSSPETPEDCKGKFLTARAEADGVQTDYYVDMVLIEKLQAYRDSWKGLAHLWNKFVTSRVTTQKDAYFSDKVQELWIG